MGAAHRLTVPLGRDSPVSIPLQNGIQLLTIIFHIFDFFFGFWTLEFGFLLQLVEWAHPTNLTVSLWSLIKKRGLVQIEPTPFLILFSCFLLLDY
jgi:hypothetical protein